VEGGARRSRVGRRGGAMIGRLVGWNGNPLLFMCPLCTALRFRL